MKDETKKFLEEIKANPSSGISHDAKMTQVQVEEVFAIDKLTEEVTRLKDGLVEYSKTSNQESRAMRYLTIALGIVAVLQLVSAIKQVHLAEEQNISERITQKRDVQRAVEFCNQDKSAQDSGLFEISTGKSASCEEVLETYQGNNSIWSRIRSLLW
jgi:hypothetical protein